MDGERVEPDVDLLALRPALTGLARALDSLRERLDRWESARSRPAQPTWDPGRPSADADARALDIVQEILAIPSADLLPGEIFTLAMDRASRLLAADRAMLLVAEPGGDRLVPRAARGFRREDLAATSVQFGAGMIGRAFEERRVVTYTAGGAGEASGDAFVERFPVHEAIAVPVRGEDGASGVVYVGRRRQGAAFSTSDVLLLLVIADRVGAGLVHQTLLDRRARHAAWLVELGGAAGTLLAMRPMNEMLSDVCAIGCRLVGVHAAAVALGATVDELEVAAAWGLPAGAGPGQRARTREGLAEELYGGADVIACRDVQSRPVRDRGFLGDAGFRGCLLLPLTSKGATMGVLYLAGTEARDFSADEIAAARVLAAMTASAIDNGRWGAALRSALASAPSTLERAAQIEKARTLSEMAAGLARELNNVFATILGKSRLLLARTHDEPLRDGLELLEEAAWRGADLVHRLVGLTARAPGVADGLVDMSALVRDVVAGARPRGDREGEGHEAGIDVVTDLVSVPAVRGRETALGEALMSLVMNAVEAMGAGGQLSVSTRPLEGGVELVLEDTGEGIAESVRGRVFDPFFTTRAPRHMGLGLTLAQGVIVQHGGRIEISSAPTRGTRVTLWLPGVEAGGPAPVPPGASAAMTAERPAATQTDVPVASAGGTEPPTATASRSPVLKGEAPAPEAAPSRAAGPGAPARIEAASILVLEDEAPVRSLLVEALTQAGHRVETAVDGISGLAKLDARSFDVVVADLALPQRSGLAIARSVKRIHPRTPVVLITGWGHLLDPARLREHGVDLVLVKPFRIERVLSVVGEALRLRALS